MEMLVTINKKQVETFVTDLSLKIKSIQSKMAEAVPTDYYKDALTSIEEHFIAIRNFHTAMMRLTDVDLFGMSNNESHTALLRKEFTLSTGIQVSVEKPSEQASFSYIDLHPFYYIIPETSKLHFNSFKQQLEGFPEHPLCSIEEIYLFTKKLIEKHPFKLKYRGRLTRDAYREQVLLSDRSSFTGENKKQLEITRLGEMMKEISIGLDGGVVAISISRSLYLELKGL